MTDGIKTAPRHASAEQRIIAAQTAAPTVGARRYDLPRDKPGLIHVTAYLKLLNAATYRTLG